MIFSPKWIIHILYSVMLCQDRHLSAFLSSPLEFFSPFVIAVGKVAVRMRCSLLSNIISVRYLISVLAILIMSFMLILMSFMLVLRRLSTEETNEVQRNSGENVKKKSDWVDELCLLSSFT